VAGHHAGLATDDDQDMPVAVEEEQQHADEKEQKVPRGTWNRLPTELKLLRSTTTFHRQLETFLFQSAYGHQGTD